MTIKPTCLTCKHAVPNSVEWCYGEAPKAPDYPLTCALSTSSDGAPAHKRALAVAYDAEGYAASLSVKTDYSCPQYKHGPTPKLVEYQHTSTTHENFQHHLNSLRSGLVGLPANMAGRTVEAAIDKLQATVEARFATGAKHVLYPLRKPCEGWSDETGCPGHTIRVGVKPT